MARCCRVTVVGPSSQALPSTPSCRQQQFLFFEVEGMGSFYCNWRPPVTHQCTNGRCPLVVSTPGYSGGFDAGSDPTESCVGSGLTAEAGYGLLHINPLGYGTPRGNDLSKRTPVSDEVQSIMRANGCEWMSSALHACCSRAYMYMYNVQSQCWHSVFRVSSRWLLVW